MHLFSPLLFITSLLGLAYLGAANAAAIAFMRRRPSEPVTLPSITVLKPVCGLEDGLYDNLASFCVQDYPDFDVVFCLPDERDPAAPLIQRVVAAFPHCSATVAAGGNPAHRNPKIANVSKPAAAARGDIVVIADSDVRVGPSYLRSIAAAFDGERVGAVTCLYRGMPNRDWVSQLGAAYVEEQFAPSVLVAAALEGPRFCLGATMAVRRKVLAAIGGIDVLGPYLADDHQLGRRVADCGFDVVLARTVVATTIPETTLQALFSHELRWARTNLVLAPAGYALSFLMFGVPLAVAYLIVSGDLAIGLPVLAAAVALRWVLHRTARAALGVRRASPPWLVPLRDVASVVVWAASFFGRSVRWRQSQIDVAADGTVR